MEPPLEPHEPFRAPVGRLAPSPTGKLHLGNARSFLLAWLSIRQQKGSIILRIEDIDSARVKPGAVEATVGDLRWLGLDWDYGPDLPPALIGHVPVTQSRRLDRYRGVLERLIQDGRVYTCRCTRSQIAQAAFSAPHESGWTHLEGPIYPGTCRQERAVPTLVEDGQLALRWAFEPGKLQWFDQLQGFQSADPLNQLGDFVIGRTSGLPAYQLAVVADDYDMGVTEVVRGSDLTISTFRQVDILRHLGWPIPKYYHVPLMLSSDGRRMAKRQDDSIAELQRQQVAPEKIIGYLAWSAGLIDRIEPVAARDLIGSLQWHNIPKHPTIFSGKLE